MIPFLVFFFIVCVIILIVRRVKDMHYVEMKSSSIHGNGMFATCDIKADTVIERAPIIPIDRTNDLTDTSLLRRYDITYKDKHAVMLGYASIYNHKDTNNAEWDFDPDKDVLVIKSVKNIKKGDEIFVNYGDKYWSSKPGEKKD